MEHLPVASTGAVEGLTTVPFVCQKPYDGGPFLTYPIRVNRPEIVPDANRVGQQPLFEYERLHPTPNKDFESFCQTWLFFGLINEFLGDICRSDDFVRRGEGGEGRILSTSRLPGLIEQWMKSVEDGSSDVNYEHVATCLRLTYATLTAAGSEFDASVKFCIASVGELFEYAANIAFRVENLVSDNQCPASWHVLIDKTPWIERLGVLGWCPSQIGVMTGSALSLQSLHFYASVKASTLEGRHDMCDGLKCVAYQTNLTDYTTQHVAKDCKCEEFHVDVSRLDHVLSTGATALLRIREGEKLNELTAEIVLSEPDSTYLALSHVWADGLGNAKANALPRCQLLRLSKLTEGLRMTLDPEKPPVELLLWCDTLCCPVTPGKAKNQVLARMKDIYEQATGVLVLDASLILHESKAVGPEEICAMILSSGWMRRLWTLQEGVLPAPRERLWFQFHDQALSFFPLHGLIVDSYKKNWSHRGLTTDLLARTRFLFAFFHEKQVADLGTVDSAFENRSVSVLSDEPLLIGTLLRLDVNGILNGSDETRMHRMWSLMPAAVHGLPKSIIFRLGPRLKEEGYRWAPSTMLYHESTNLVLETLPNVDGTGTPTKHGLMVRLSGYHMSFPQRPGGLPVDLWNFLLDENILYMRDEGANWYLVRRRGTDAEGDFLSKERFSGSMRNRTNLWVTLFETGFQARSDGVQQTTTALLTTLIRETDEVKYVNSYMHIHIWPYRKDSSEMFEAAYRCAEKLARSDPAQRLAQVRDEDIDMERLDYKALIDALESDIQRLFASGDFDKGLRLARQSSGKDNDVFFEAIVRVLFLGRYAIRGPKTKDSQRWCVD